MTQEILDFIGGNRVGVLGVLLKDGSPHGATVHYSHQDDPLAFYISTDSDSKKCEALKEGKAVKATFVIGVSEDEMITFQADGDIVRVLEPAELKAAQAIHYKKHPQAEKFKDDPDSSLLKFTPTWWRFSDYSAGKPRITTI